MSRLQLPPLVPQYQSSRVQTGLQAIQGLGPKSLQTELQTQQRYATQAPQRYATQRYPTQQYATQTIPGFAPYPSFGEGGGLIAGGGFGEY